MASITSRGPSPHPSPYDFESPNDTDESWQYVDYSSGASATASVGFLPSPASGSLNGFAIVGHLSTRSPQPAAVSPVPMGEMDHSVFLPSATSYPAGSDDFPAAGFVSPDESFMAPHQFLFTQPEEGDFSQAELNELGPFMSTFTTDMFPSLDQTNQDQRQVDLNTSQPFQSDANVSPWNPTALRSLGDDVFSFDDFLPASSTDGSNVSSSPRSPGTKSDSNSSKSPTSIRRVKVGKIEKKKSDQSGKFVIMTPTSINAYAGKPNPFECFEAEAMRTSQRGRKGPLANDTKESALQVRRLGACFCCHSRKVKCDKERPCKHCKKLMVQVPQVVCWQFQDFLTILFPEFIRGHFRKEEMSKFLRENVDGFSIAGMEQPCDVELFSGPRFGATLSIKAKFFTAKTCEVLQHWHLTTGKDRADLQSNGSAPIGLELSNSAQRDGLRKLAKAYIQEIVKEPAYAEQVTETFRSTQLPTKVLRIVQTFAKQSDSAMVKRALSIYAMHYVMTRHLCLTRQSIMTLQPSGLVPQNTPWVTPRVLARQIKAIIDELIMREMQQLFDLFSKSLKPKARREWAPCLAAFLVLCLYMEAVETTADNFVITHNEVNLRNKYAPEYQRTFALDTCKEVENMPFKQFAYQFHNIYQTHSKDANTKPFNPLVNDDFVEQGELDGPAVQLVGSLRELFHGEDWQDMQFLVDDDILLNREQHPSPMDTSFLYTGRLVAKFLLSFMNENAIFGSQI